ncbi:hypothetical protein H4S02_012370, partial [Coemansia sp. RSA 2611]
MDVEDKQGHLAGSSDIYTDDYESEHEYDDDHNSDDDDDGEDGDTDDDDDDEGGDDEEDKSGHVEGDDKQSKSNKISQSSKYGQFSDSIESVATKVHPSSTSSEHGEYYAQPPFDAQSMAHTLHGLNMAHGHPSMFEATSLGSLQHHGPAGDMPYALTYTNATHAPPMAVDPNGSI